MDINPYIKEISSDINGIHITLKNDKRFNLIDNVSPIEKALIKKKLEEEIEKIKNSDTKKG